MSGAEGGTAGGGAAGAGAAGAAGGGAPAGGAAGAGAPASGAGAQGASGGAGAGASDWTAALSEDARGYAQNKGWKSPGDLLESARNLEKLIGYPQDKILKIPAGEDTEGWDAAYHKLGRPATAADYKLETPKDGGDAEFTKWAGETFHKMGLNDRQAKGLLEGFNTKAKERADARKQAVVAETQKAEAELKKEWGAAYDDNRELARRAAKQFGMDAATIDKIEAAAGATNTIKFLNAVGKRLGEGSFVRGQGAAGGDGRQPMEPAAAKAEIKNLIQDKGFFEKIRNRDADALAKWERLNRWASPESA